jgi:hypothetical protein
MTVHWTDEMREKVVVRRGHGEARGKKIARAKLVGGVKLAAKDIPGSGYEANQIEFRWEELRAALACAPKGDYEAALDAARAMWPKQTDLVPRCALAYAFPDEADWAESATRALLDQIKKQKGKIFPYEIGVALLGAVAVPELQTALAKAAAAKRMAIYVLTNQVATMVDLTGDAAAEGLAALLATAPSNNHKKDYSEALALIESDAAALGLAAALAQKTVLPIAKAYFERFPSLASAALGKIAKGSTTSAPLASQMLRAK